MKLDVLCFPPIRVTTLLMLAYLATLAYRSAMAARHERAGDRLFLMAVVVPWVTMYAVLPQMHDRYLTYAACLSAMWVCLGVGPFLCHIALTGLALLAYTLGLSLLSQYRCWSEPRYRAARYIKEHIVVPDKVYAPFYSRAAGLPRNTSRTGESAELFLTQMQDREEILRAGNLSRKGFVQVSVRHL